MKRSWKVGELAKATAITVRTLHHYDELGLLRPSGRTECGHRLYTKDELDRLHHIVALRHLGFSLEQVAEVLRRPDVSPLTAIASVRRELHDRRAAIDDLDERLAAVEQSMVNGGEVSTKRLLQLIERMTMYEKYLTGDQLAKIKARTDALDPDRVRACTERDWPELLAAIKAEEAQGTDPSDPRAQALARRWTALTEEFTGGDPALSAGLGKMYEQDSEAFARDKVSGYGEAAVADLARCVRYIARALKSA